MYSEKLMRALKSLRADLANEAGVPLYVIFSNATLADMCRRLPRTPEEFLEVSGVGRAKQQKYAERFLKVIAQYAEEA